MAHIGQRDVGHTQFWEVADPLIGEGIVVEGTMMGQQCLRSGATNGFVATVERSSGSLVVKLPKHRVAELIAAGVGSSFAPAGKVFSEWVAVSEFDEDRWVALISESIEFVDG